MAKKVEAYACDHFNEDCLARCRTWQSRSTANKKQKSCLMNPDLKGCYSCIHFDYKVDAEERTLTRRCTNGYDAEYVRKGLQVIKSNVRTLCDRHKTKFQEMQELEESTDIINL